MLASSFTPPDAHFAHVHIDIVRPLPTSRGYPHLLTAVDCFTRWPEAIPLTDTSTETVGFLLGWIARFSVPTSITSDRGSQFESGVWHCLMKLLGTHYIRTTAYHPCTNGMAAPAVEGYTHGTQSPVTLD